MLKNRYLLLLKSQMWYCHVNMPTCLMRMMNVMLTSANELDVYHQICDSVPILRAYWDVRMYNHTG